RIPISDEIANCIQAIRDCFFGNHFTIDANSFAERNEVRGGEQAGAIFLRTQDRINHCANGAFPIGSGDVDDPGAAEIDMELGDEPLDIFEPEFNPEALKAVEPGERLSVIHGTTEK
ncbi:MAG: hypothetical protein DME72_04340, partial [Verrucomicrobia bacterium]